MGTGEHWTYFSYVIHSCGVLPENRIARNVKNVLFGLEQHDLEQLM